MYIHSGEVDWKASVNSGLQEGRGPSSVLARAEGRGWREPREATSIQFSYREHPRLFGHARVNAFTRDLYITECIDLLVSESHPPQKIVNLFTLTD